jgi:hypothetical protein
VAVWVLLALSAKLGVHLAAANDLHGAERIAVADGTYFAANCVTFLLRFLLFHYILFADPRSPREQAAREQAALQQAAGSAAPGAPADNPEPLADVTPDRP